MVGDFRAKAAEKGVDISDVKLEAITMEQLKLLATTRLG